jgi:hypothetical protein
MAAEAGWRFCGKCNSMFFNGFPDFKGVCPAGGGHVPPPPPHALNFVLSHDLPQLLTFDFNSIVFEDGVPVGGNAHLSINQDGAYNFRGHFHDSGAVDFDISIVCAVKDAQNRVYTFSQTGEVGGPSQLAQGTLTGIATRRTIELPKTGRI